MSDDSYRLLIRSIMKCVNAADKINIIKSSIHSLQEFIDILNADCLFEDEFAAVFSTLSDMELSVLGKIVFYEEVRSGSLSLSTMIIDEKEIETEWEEQYIKFIQTLSKGRIELIERCINIIL